MKRKIDWTSTTNTKLHHKVSKRHKLTLGDLNKTSAPGRRALGSGHCSDKAGWWSPSYVPANEGWTHGCPNHSAPFPTAFTPSSSVIPRMLYTTRPCVRHTHRHLLLVGRRHPCRCCCSVRAPPNLRHLLHHHHPVSRQWTPPLLPTGVASRRRRLSPMWSCLGHHGHCHHRDHRGASRGRRWYREWLSRGAERLEFSRPSGPYRTPGTARGGTRVGRLGPL